MALCWKAAAMFYASEGKETSSGRNTASHDDVSTRRVCPQLSTQNKTGAQKKGLESSADSLFWEINLKAKIFQNDNVSLRWTVAHPTACFVFGVWHERANVLNLHTTLQPPSLLGAGTADLSVNISKNAEDSIRTSPGSCEPRLRNDSQLSYDPHRRLLCFTPADFSLLDVFLILEGSLFVSSRE